MTYKEKGIQNLKETNEIYDNLLPLFSEDWEKIDASGKGDMTPFYFSEDMTAAVIDNRKPYATLKKYMFQTEIVPGKTYEINVPFEEYETPGQNVVYGILTLKNKEAKMTRRMYLDRKKSGHLSFIFQSEEEVAVLLELGIKREGKVIWYRPILRECDPIKPRKVRLASVYLGFKTVNFPYEENLKHIEECFDRAAAEGVDLVGFSEDANTTWTDNLQAYETLDGPFCTLMKRKAKEHSCYAFFSLHELDEHGCKKNTAVLVDRNGELVGTCSKSHLTLGEYEKGLVPGNGYPVFETDFGKIGMLVCWDSYFPETSRAMAFQGAELLLISTAGNPHFRHVAIAKENGVYVLVSCRYGKIKPEEGVAPTKIISPCGEILAQCNTDGEAAKAEIDLNDSGTIHYLSLGNADAYPHNVYMHEWRDDLYGAIK